MFVGLACAIVASHILGFLWYSPLLFGNIWLRHTFPGRKIEDMQKEKHGFELFITFISSIFMYTTLFYILGYMSALKNVIAALKMAMLLCGFLTASQVCHHAYMGRPLVMFFIELGFDSSVTMIASFCFAYFA